ncbi:MAG: hypothetical protein A2297_04495 [Elusimicrobia bacterium RIFOXYB2_FULL_48_7]|nr:MAG: hypothetical protein A2297_04495 [Elusimicrobia bacterium RIFOXYB2_FULL_48_7]
MYASELDPALDHLATLTDRVWVGNAADIQKYKDERDSAVTSGITAGASSISLTLTSSESTYDYDYPLTLITEVPASWSYARVTQGSINAKKTYAVDVWVSSRSVRYDAIPGYGTITLDSVAGIDASAPNSPGSVYDGTGTDIDVTTDTDHVDANWLSSADAESGVKKYWYKIGVTAGGAELLDWIDNGTFTYVSTRRTNIALSKGVTYYFTVKAENGDGLLSPEINSDGFLVSRSAGDVMFYDDFETGNNSKWTANSNGANSLTVSTEAAYRGAYGLKVHIGGSNAVYLTKTNLSTINDNFIRFNFKLSPGFTMPEVYASTESKLLSLCVIRDSSNVMVGSVYLCNTKGNISVYSQFVDDDDWQCIPWGFGSGAGYIPVTPGVWHSFDIHVRALSKERGGNEMWLDGIKVCSTMNRSMPGKDARLVRVGVNSIGQGISGDVYIDDFYCSDNYYHLSALNSGPGSDSTPPSAPGAVRDGSTAGVDISSVASATTLSANWDTGADGESGISGYQYAIGTTAGGVNTLGWQTLGNLLTVTRSGLSLSAGTTYYFTVKSVNGAGTPSATATNSNGVVVVSTTDATAPNPPVAVRDGTGADVASTISSSQLTANWDAGSDAESGISGYRYAIGTTPGGINTLGWQTLGNVLTVTRSGLSLTAGATYYFTVRSLNGSNTPSAAAANSNGQYVVAIDTSDVTPPSSITVVRDGTGADQDSAATNTTELSANWDAAADPESGVAKYWYAIGFTAGGTEVVAWTDNGPATAFTETGLLYLAEGNTYYVSVKAENSVGLQTSTTTSDGICINRSGGGGDTTGPAISAVSAGNITATGAVIAWTTDELSTSRVEYGLTSAYGQSTTETAATDIAHSVTLSGLTAGTLYHYRVSGRDASDNPAGSADYTFTTASAAINTSANAYPNPVTLSSGLPAKFRIAGAGASGGEVSIYTLSGRLVRKLTAGAGAADASWNLKNTDGEKIKVGLYVFKITDAGGTRTGKIAIVK